MDYSSPFSVHRILVFAGGVIRTGITRLGLGAPKLSGSEGIPQKCLGVVRERHSGEFITESGI